MLRAVRITDGKEMHQIDSGSYTAASPALVGGFAYYGTFDNQVLAVDLAKRDIAWRYDGVGKPLWSKATGWTRLEPQGDGRTPVHFRETYHVFNPLLRFLLERRVHRFISKDNDVLMRRAIQAGVERNRADFSPGSTR